MTSSDQAGIVQAKFRIALTGKSGILSIGDDIEALLGFKADDFLTANVSLQGQIHPHDQDIADVLFSTDTSDNSGYFNLRLRQANGRIRCVKGHYTKTMGADGIILDLLLQDAKSIWRTHEQEPLMANFVAMMENTDDFIFFKDRNHVFTGASQTLVAVTDPIEHWTDLLGQTDYDVFPEEYADLYYRLEKQVFAGIQVAHEVQESLTKDGKNGWVDNRKYPIHDAEGEIVGLFGIARDISKAKLAEQALAESELRFRTIFEQVPSISVQGYDRNHRVIFWNEASESLYGHSRKDALGKPLEQLIIPEPMREIVSSAIDQWLAGGPAIPAAELTLHRADGRPVGVFSSHVMLKNINGEPEMYCIDIDLTERKQVENLLRDEHDKNINILNTVEAIIVAIDPDGRISTINRKGCKLLGYT
jgi:hypothetical protein